jgi:hypothetical protein
MTTPRAASGTHFTLLMPFAATVAAAWLVAGCGGGGSALENPPDIHNPAGSASGGKLSFIYFQKCINPLLLAKIVSSTGTNTCASAGCHDNVSGTGGALRIAPGATEVADLSNPDTVRATDMYKNFYTSQGVTLVGDPDQSRLLNKPLVRGVLHGGGLIFDNDQDINARRIRYWISRPVPSTQDEFSSAAAAMFTPADPQTGSCNAD